MAGKTSHYKHLLFLFSCECCPLEALDPYPIPQLHVTHTPHFTFLSLNPSCMWGSRTYEINFYFLLLIVSCQFNTQISQKNRRVEEIFFLPNIGISASTTVVCKLFSLWYFVIIAPTAKTLIYIVNSERNGVMRLMNIESFVYVKTYCSLEHTLENSYLTHLEMKLHSVVKYI